MKNHFAVILLILAFVLSACVGPAATAEPEATAPSTPDKFITFGDISDDPAEVIEGAQPIASYLASKLGDYGITAGQVKIASSTEEMTEMLKSGEVDVYFDSTYPATLISDASGGKIVMRRWRFGVETYNSVIFASIDSGITSIDQLNGKMMALDAPYSTSGFLLPAVYLKEKGFTLTGKKASGDPVSSDEIGFTFAYDDENILQLVLSGAVPAGATDDFHFDIDFPEDAKAKLVELARTESTPRQVMVARPNMDPNLLQAIIKVLSAMDKDPEAKAALDNFQTEKFDEFPEGLDAATSRMREMADLIKDIPLP